jgi:hypothetical protein
VISPSLNLNASQFFLTRASANFLAIANPFILLAMTKPLSWKFQGYPEAT